MNKRIREIERQSGIEIYGLGKDRAKWEHSLEKFTELIVNECIKLNGKELSMAAHSRMLEIYTDHFGVEQ